MNQYTSKITVIDYGMGNIGSVLNMLRYLGARPTVATEPNHLLGAKGIVLPGVGHFDRAMESLTSSGMADSLREAAINSEVPVLGICLGMQLMCKSSEEGSVSGLSLVDAQVRRFNFVNKLALKIPHMGWNNVMVQRNGTILGDSGGSPDRFYFVHSYHVSCENTEDIIGVTSYGVNFVSAFQRKNIIGVQFHPEKSHKYGLRLLDNFLKLLA
jgi:glutamine amidotransferase